MTLVTDSGNFSFTKTEKGWHAESAVASPSSGTRTNTRITGARTSSNDRRRPASTGCSNRGSSGSCSTTHS